MEAKLNSMESIIEEAIRLGASSANIINAGELIIEDRFVELCGPDQCSGYGKSINCPPYSMKPSVFRGLVKNYEHCLVFKIDVPMETLLSDDYLHVTRLIHELAAWIEGFAKSAGFARSKGFATGSCKQLFCNEYKHCRVLEEINGECRFTDTARPSLSGLGLNFNKLGLKLQWQNTDFEIKKGIDNKSMGLMAGIVLLD